MARMADLTETDRTRLLKELETLQDTADVLIIDTGAGIGRNVLAFTAAADQNWIVLASAKLGSRFMLPAT